MKEEIIEYSTKSDEGEDKNENKSKSKTTSKSGLDTKDDLENFAFQVAKSLSDKGSVDKSDISGFKDDVMEEGMLFTGALITGFLNSSEEIQSEILENAMNANAKSSNNSNSLSNSSNDTIKMLDNIISHLVDNPNVLDDMGLQIPEHIKDLLLELAETKRKFNKTGNISDEDIKKAKAKLKEAIGQDDGESEEDEFEKYKGLANFDPDKYSL